MESLERRYTTAEVATMYHCTQRTVMNWISRGRLTAVDLSGAGKGPYAIRPSDIAAFERSFETRRET